MCTDGVQKYQAQAHQAHNIYNSVVLTLQVMQSLSSII